MAAKNDSQAGAEAKVSGDSAAPADAPDQVNAAATTQDKPAARLAKAGKRSAKALREAEVKRAKQERKAAPEPDGAPTAAVKPKPTRSRLERRGKGYRQSAQLIDRHKRYNLSEAIGLARQTSHVKFDATVELHVRLAVDPKQADQNVRDSVILPAGTGKPVRVAVFADVDDSAAAKQAGADLAGADEVLEQLDKAEINFDVLIATPAMMPKLSRYARLLGPKGLMPNPKSGTVTSDVAKAVRDAKGGRVEYRVDSTGIVHVGIGKVSFSAAQLMNNASALLGSIRANKPASVKGVYIKDICLATSMGPSIRLDPAEAAARQSLLQ